ncbi:MAG: hypothetical protein FWD68_02075 [Alphaproteobacteria bacterium]|nr:hypothetical protein [Alphaproteobacteria bacterium]
MDQSWTEGCILLGTEDLGISTIPSPRYFPNNGLMYEGQTPTRSLDDSQRTMRGLIALIHQLEHIPAGGMLKPDQLDCVKLVITNEWK